MNKVKLYAFDLVDSKELENRINEWIEKNNIEIISINTSLSYDEGSGRSEGVITIVYGKNRESSYEDQLC